MLGEPLNTVHYACETRHITHLAQPQKMPTYIRIFSLISYALLFSSSAIVFTGGIMVSFVLPASKTTVGSINSDSPWSIKLSFLGSVIFVFVFGYLVNRVVWSAFDEKR